jgi:hypothetical protein
MAQETFRISQERIPEMLRREYVIVCCVLLGILLLLGGGLWLNAAFLFPADPSKWPLPGNLLLVLVVPLALAVLMVLIIWGPWRKTALMQVEWQLDDDAISVRHGVNVEIRIGKDAITHIDERPNGGIAVTDGNRAITIPPTVSGFEQIRTRLEAWHPFDAPSVLRRLMPRQLEAILFILICTLMIADVAFLWTRPPVIALTAIALPLLLFWRLYVIPRVYEFDPRGRALMPQLITSWTVMFIAKLACVWLSTP